MFLRPYTSQQALDKVLELARLLTVYCGRMIVHIIPFTEIQEEIRRQCPEEYFTLIMRRFMMRIAEAVARKSHASALVTGESLGQVASQTIKALGVTEDVTKMPVLRPLIGTDKVEIIRMAREIGTYETSILPYEDCCTVFTPRHPATRPVLEDVVQAESVLDIDGLVAKALEGETWVRGKALTGSERRHLLCHIPLRSLPSVRNCFLEISPTPTPARSHGRCLLLASMCSGIPW